MESENVCADFFPYKKVDSIEFRWLPFGDLSASTGVVGTCIDSENESVILVLEFIFFFGDDVCEDFRCIPHLKHFLHVHINFVGT